MFTVIVSNARELVTELAIKKLNKAKKEADTAKKQGYTVEVYNAKGKLVHS